MRILVSNTNQYLQLAVHDINVKHHINVFYYVNGYLTDVHYISFHHLGATSRVTSIIVKHVYRSIHVIHSMTPGQ